MMMRASLCGMLASVALFGATSALAGPITPPPGPVASTHKTLSEVEPRIALNSTNTPGDFDSVFKITQSGSYYLTGNVTGASGRMGIEVVATDVTIDLNGFSLIGSVGSLDGIATAPGVRSVVVRNGTVSGWGGYGLNLYSGSTVLAARVEGVIARSNGNAGISLGPNAIARDCSAESNESSGFELLLNGVLENCVSRENGGAGVITGNAVAIRASSFRQNGTAGIQTGIACLIVDCAAFDNIGSGIVASSFAKVENCTSVSNGGHGISVGASSSVQSCVAGLNGASGVVAASDCLIIDNNCDSNGGGLSPNAGILIEAPDCVVEGNNSTDNPVGIRVTVAGSFIARNVCSGNSLNWDIVANNKCLVVNGVNAGAINGNSGGVSPGSADPNANYTY